jgi:alanine dehydrogenase
MRIGIIKEIKIGEGRVAMTPNGVKTVLSSGKHQIYVETHAGETSGFSDQEYHEAGAKILPSAENVFQEAQLIVHVKEPLPNEYNYIRSDHIIFTYLHLAPEPELTRKLLEKKCTCFAYETLETKEGKLPLLAPMSKVAGKMAFVYSVYCQQRLTGGQGIYLGQIDGIPHGRALIIGGGVVGINAAESFVGIGSEVVIIEKKPAQRMYLQQKFPTALVSSEDALREELSKADVIIGAVLVPGAKAPHLIKSQDFSLIKKRAVIVDISIDQGGITDVSRPTSIQNPTYVIDDVIMTCIPNIPGTVPRTSTTLLTEATLPYVIKLANKGIEIIREDKEFQSALNIFDGKCTNKHVAEDTGLTYTPIDEILENIDAK